MEGEVVYLRRPANCLQLTDEQFAEMEEDLQRDLIEIYTKKRECSEENQRFRREFIIGIDNPYWPPHAKLSDDPSDGKFRPIRVLSDPVAVRAVMEFGLKRKEKRLRLEREALQRQMELQAAEESSAPDGPSAGQ